MLGEERPKPFNALMRLSSLTMLVDFSLFDAVILLYGLINSRPTSQFQSTRGWLVSNLTKDVRGAEAAKILEVSLGGR